MSVFHGDWNEDPKEFLNSYLQCTAAGSDKFRARQFINYLGVDSDAEEWFDEIPHEEKKDWVAIELSFRKRWLKDSEVLSIKETVTDTTKNEPQPTPLASSLLSTPTITTSTKNDTTMPQLSKTGLPNCVATSQSLALPEWK
jgi:hypothetical protein